MISTDGLSYWTRSGRVQLLDLGDGTCRVLIFGGADAEDLADLAATLPRHGSMVGMATLWDADSGGGRPMTVLTFRSERQDT
jgi:hypothetical protein